MGLFDRFKEKNPAPQPVKGEPKSELFLVLEKLKQSKGPEVMSEFSRVLKEYVDEGTWVPMPIIEDPKGSRFRIIEARGRGYAAMYSDQSEIKAPGDIAITDINKLLEPVFANKEIAGIMIDPETTGLCLDKGYLLKCLLHGYLPQTHNKGCSQRDWGVGIPEYAQSDLMSEGEKLNFAMEVLLGNEKTFSNWTPVSACDHPSAIPNLIFEDNGQFVFVVVKGYCAETEPELSVEERNLLMSYHDRFGATCYYAPVGFRSADAMRFNACLALNGDGFYAKYTGLTKVV